MQTQMTMTPAILQPSVVIGYKCLSNDFRILVTWMKQNMFKHFFLAKYSKFYTMYRLLVYHETIQAAQDVFRILQLCC